MVTKREALESVNFGDSVAELEADSLRKYFVRTDQWKKVFNGSTDVVYGPKGSGKSAIYSLLQQQSDELANRDITFLTAENPRGATAFRGILVDPPAAEVEFIQLWKLYFLSLIGEFLDGHRSNADARFVTTQLRLSGLLPEAGTLAEKFSAAWRYVQRGFNWEQAEGEIKLDPATSLPIGINGKIVFGTPKPELTAAGLSSIDALLERSDRALQKIEHKIWIGIDRLDVAFPENDELEINALRALFKIYLDFQAYPNISPKIFLRTDIWKKITERGLREASHITRTLTIEWNKDSLLNLLMRRAIQSDILCNFYKVNSESVLNEITAQRDLYARMFPVKIDIGTRRPSSFDWILSRIKDGSGYTAPRELIQLVTAARDEQVKSLEIGSHQPADEVLFTGAAFKNGLKSLSNQRLIQTLYAEYPKMKPLIEQLKGKKATQTIKTLAMRWGFEESTTADNAEKLVSIGFFEKQGNRETPIYWVPFLYRDALGLLQGKADL